MLASILAGCHGGAGGGLEIDAPAYIAPHARAQVEDLHNCFRAHGMVLRQPSRVEVVPIPCEGWQEYPWFAIGNIRVYGVAYGDEIHLAVDGQTFSDVVLRHEIGHVFATVNGIQGIHPPELAVCLPAWYGNVTVPYHNLVDGAWIWPADTVESWQAALDSVSAPGP